MNKKNLGRLIVHFRNSRGISQRQFAGLVKCSFSTLSKLENGSQEARSELLMRIFDLILPHFNTDIMLLESECEMRSKQREDTLYCGAI